jgi:hypothetical protein
VKKKCPSLEVQAKVMEAYFQILTSLLATVCSGKGARASCFVYFSDGGIVLWTSGSSRFNSLLRKMVSVSLLLPLVMKIVVSQWSKEVLGGHRST